MKMYSVLLLPIALLTLCSFVAADEAKNPPLITVQGSAEVKVVPDEVLITLGNETANKSVKEAIRINDEQIKRLLETIKKSGIDAKHIQTSSVNVRPEYRDDDNHGQQGGKTQSPVPLQGVQTPANTPENYIKYFIAQKTIVVTVKDTAKVEGLLSNIYETGVTQISDVDFRSTELRKHRDKARDMAMKAAREKAIAMAKAVDQKIGRALFINESTGSSYGYNRVAQGSFENNPNGQAEETTGSIALGQISITANVTVQFELP